MARALQNRRAIDRSKPAYKGKKGRSKFPLKFFGVYKGQSKKTQAWVAHVKAVRAAHGGGKTCSYRDALSIASKSWKGR